jgi:hypothetical protein
LTSFFQPDCSDDSDMMAALGQVWGAVACLDLSKVPTSVLNFGTVLGQPLHSLLLSFCKCHAVRIQLLPLPPLRAAASKQQAAASSSKQQKF